MAFHCASILGLFLSTAVSVFIAKMSVSECMSKLIALDFLEGL